jgi:hypothetical protein
MQKKVLKLSSVGIQRTHQSLAIPSQLLQIKQQFTYSMQQQVLVSKVKSKNPARLSGGVF